MTWIPPAGLDELLQFGDLPVVALTAAVDHRELRWSVALRRKLSPSVIERCFVPGAPPTTDAAQQLVWRPLAAKTVRWILRDAAERRPRVLAALVRDNVPDARERGWLLAHPDPTVGSAVLANPDWPVDEQLPIARRSDGRTILEWLARLDPAVSLAPEELFGDLVGDAAPGRASRGGRSAGWRLDGDPVTALQAMLRRPWLADLPPFLLSREARSAAATISSDERTLFALLGYAQQLAVTGRTRDAAGIVEAVACNPTASLAVQRRARRLDRRLACHYLRGWRPAAVADGPLWESDEVAQRRVMDRLDDLVAVRHRTVWSAGLLALNPGLAEDVRRRLVAYLEEHLPGVDYDGSSVDVLADRLGLSTATRRRWRRRCAAVQPYTCNFPPGLDPNADRRWGRRLIWEELQLEDMRAAGLRRLAVRRLRAAFGRDREAWSLAFLLLREGWALPLSELPSVVAVLRADPTDEEEAA